MKSLHLIPTDKPKQIKCYCGHTITCDCGPLEEPKQETLEEAAENYARNEPDATLKLISKYSFKDGAKWQQERMYSEEEVENILIEYVKTNPTKPYRVVQWFEQFKKKV